MKYRDTKEENWTFADNPKLSLPSRDIGHSSLRADCKRCFGLCCVALYFSASAGFPVDKEAGQPCINLKPDYRCKVYPHLIQQGLKGCFAFDCFGAGQKVSQISFSGQDWQNHPESAQTMFRVFLIMRQLHEMLWYLADGLNSESARSIHGELSSMLEKTQKLTLLTSTSLLELEIFKHREEVNALLLKTSRLVRSSARREAKKHKESYKNLGRRKNLIAADLKNTNLAGANLRGTCLIAADLSNTVLHGADCIGADFRDTNLRGADLSRCVFLTQAQLNVALGNSTTKLPSSLARPRSWD